MTNLTAVTRNTYQTVVYENMDDNLRPRIHSLLAMPNNDNSLNATVGPCFNRNVQCR